MVWKEEHAYINLSLSRSTTRIDQFDALYMCTLASTAIILFGKMMLLGLNMDLLVFPFYKKAGMGKAKRLSDRFKMERHP
jgi:hypothetical protein